MKIIDIGDKRYLVKGTEAVEEEGIDTDELKKQWNADSALRNGNTLYLCQEIKEIEFEDLD